MGLLAFAGVALGGTALGYLAERRSMGDRRLTDDPEWLELRQRPPHVPHTVASGDGTALRAYVHGTTGPPTIVLAHGYGLSSRFWHYQTRDLPPSFRVVAYDQRGHGSSARAASGDYTPEALGADLDAVICATVPAGERCVVVGHSMGGMSILAYAEARGAALRERVAGAVICNSAASRLIAGSAWSTGVAALGAIEERIGLRALARGVGRGSGGGVDGGTRAGVRTNDLTFLLTRALSMHADAHPAHVAFVEQLLIDVPTDIKATLATTLGTLDLSAALRSMDVPTLVITGERDRLTPVAQSEGLVAALPDARLLVVDSVGHHAPLEAHVEVTGAIRSHAEAALRPRGGRRRSARRKAG